MQERPRIEPGRVLSEIFRTYRLRAGLLLTAAVTLFVPIALIGLLLPDDERNAWPVEVLVYVALPVANLAGTYWYQGLVVEMTRDIRDGRRDFSLGSLFGSVTPVLGALVVAGVLAGLGISVGFVLFAPGLVLLTWWALISPVFVIERTRMFAAFGRSRALVRGNCWPVLRVLLVVFLIQGVLAGVVALISAAAGARELARDIASLVANVLGAPLFALAAATIYFRLSETPARTPESTVARE